MCDCFMNEGFRLQCLEDEYKHKLQEEPKKLAKLLSKKNMYSAKKEEYTKKIRELGQLTSDALMSIFLYIHTNTRESDVNWPNSLIFLVHSSFLAEYIFFLLNNCSSFSNSS